MKKDCKTRGLYVPGIWYQMRKILIMMKLSLFILLLSLLSAEASVFSQNSKLNLDYRNVSLKEVLGAIEDQSEFRFAFSSEYLDLNRKVSVRYENESVTAILDNIFKETNIKYSIRDRVIILYQEETGSNQILQQALKVSGKVTDSSGAPLPGVTVVIKGTTQGTITDANGNYSLSNVRDDVVLVFSFVGMRTQEIPVSGKTSINVAMAEETIGLEEVVAVGYGTQRKATYTGAVAAVSAEEIVSRPVTNAIEALRGKVAGVNIIETGQPGGKQRARIRGWGSLENNEPLYVIDGIQTKDGIDHINPNDIESISVLKDASASALYGSRGSNGVIVVTTKTGRKGEKLKISYNGRTDVKYIKKPFETTSPQEVANIIWERKENSGRPLEHPLYGNGATPVLPDWLLTANAIATGIEPSLDLYDFNNKDYRFIKANKEGTNWFKEGTQLGVTQDHSINVNGASSDAVYSFSLGYLDDKGVIKASDFTRYSMGINTAFKPAKWINIGENLTFTYSNTIGTGYSIRDLLITPEILPVYDLGGHYTGFGFSEAYPNEDRLDGTNAAKAAARTSDNSKNLNTRVLGSIFADVEPVRNLTLSSKLSIDYGEQYTQYLLVANTEDMFGQDKNSIYENRFRTIQYQILNKIAYRAEWDDHRVDAFVAMEALEYDYSYLGAQSSNLFSESPDYRYPSLGENPSIDGTGDKFALLSYFGNINYSFQDKYLISAVLRRDGSSKFGANNRWAMFPAVSVGWVATEEPFVKDRFGDVLSYLKLRTSWGQSGNDGIPSGRTIDLYLPGPSNRYSLNADPNITLRGLGLSAVGNPDLRWELNETFDIGVDFSLFNGRVRSEFDYYIKNTKDLLYPVRQSSMRGDGSDPYQNIMNFENRGFELSMTYNSDQMREFKYSVNLNIGAYRNKIKYIAEGEDFVYGTRPAENTVEEANRHYVGHPVGTFYGWVLEGIYQDENDAINHALDKVGLDNHANPAEAVGHFKFKDVASRDENGQLVNIPDGVVDADDQTILGSPHPDFTYGVTLNASYKNFDLGLFFEGVYGNKIFNYLKRYTHLTTRSGSYSTEVLTNTYGFNGNLTGPLPLMTEDNRFLDDRMSDFYIENGSYLRLSNLQLGYTFKKFRGLSDLRVFVQGSNLFVITDYSGIDPSVGGVVEHAGGRGSGNVNFIGFDMGNTYPIAKSWSIGLNITL
jgi:TonB-linked SusC/RagA family outer membrane protein